MYRVITIGGHDYRLEYTVEASLYQDCIDRLITFLGGTVGAASMADSNSLDNLGRDEQAQVYTSLANGIKSEMIGIPGTALMMFYAGLLEHHGSDGDGSVKSMKDAKRLVKQMFDEAGDNGIDNFYDLLKMCIDQMGEDGFFKRTGLETIMTQASKADGKTPENRASRRAKTRQSGK